MTTEDIKESWIEVRLRSQLNNNCLKCDSLRLEIARLHGRIRLMGVRLSDAMINGDEVERTLMNQIAQLKLRLQLEDKTDE